MKKIILIIAMLMYSCLALTAQSHLKFMDIPLNGNFEIFKEKLEAKDLRCEKNGETIFHGKFFGAFASIRIDINDKSDNVYKALVRYNQSMSGLTKNQVIALFNRIYQGLKKKYPSAKFQSTDGDVLVIMQNGYIRCQIFGYPDIVGGATIELIYVDKTNDPNFEIPKMKMREDDL